MCIIAFHFDEKNKALTVAANRDEFYERPTTALHTWQVDGVTIYGGRDLQENGTWMAVNEFGHFVAITNYRNPKLEQRKPRSRGHIAKDFLTSGQASLLFATELQQNADLYGPFNVLVYDGKTLVHYNNVEDIVTIVLSGVHVLCNATLNTPWPKVERLRERFTKVLAKAPTTAVLYRILQDEEQAPQQELPSTGVPLELEQSLSSIFIRLPNYGTRCSTIVKLTNNSLSMHELTFEKGIASSEQSLQARI